MTMDEAIDRALAQIGHAWQLAPRDAEDQKHMLALGRAALRHALAEAGYCVIATDDVAAMADYLEESYEHGRDAAVGDCKICQAIIRFRASQA